MGGAGAVEIGTHGLVFLRRAIGCREATMTIAQQLSKYREYHCDHRNVLTHAVGIPMIVLGITTLLARPVLAACGLCRHTGCRSQVCWPPPGICGSICALA